MDKIADIDDVYLEPSCHRWISIIVLEDSINLINFIDQPWISTERTLNRGVRLPDLAGMETVRPSVSGILGWTKIALLFRFAILEPECVPAPPPSDFDLPCGTRTRVLVVVPFTQFSVSLSDSPAHFVSSILTYRIFPDSPSSAQPFPKPPSPANSISNVDFLEKIPLFFPFIISLVHPHTALFYI